MALDYLQIIADESDRLRAAAHAGPLDAPVPGCPEWTLGDLAVHITEVQRWATLIIETREFGEPTEPPPTPTEAVAAFEATTPKLLAALAAADADAPCWNFTTGPQTLAFWRRRQALEVAVHRWDAESAATSTAAPIATEVAVDVVDEFLHLMLQRVIDREQLDLSTATTSLRFECTDVSEQPWTIAMTDGRVDVQRGEHQPTEATISAPAHDLALFVYGRLTLDDVDATGPTTTFESWRPAFKF